MGAYEAELDRAWRESECAEEPTAEESFAACRHADACRRLWDMRSDTYPAWDWLGCAECGEWEGA